MIAQLGSLVGKGEAALLLIDQIRDGITCIQKAGEKMKRKPKSLL
jgi:hypothetical protein